MEASAASVMVPTARLPGGVSLLLIVGAQKAGTSWLHDVLRRHPAMRTGPMKELHYFNGLYGKAAVGNRLRRRRLRMLESNGKLREAERVQRLQEAINTHDLTHKGYVDVVSSGSKPGQVAIDATPAYATLGTTAFAAMEALGNSRFLFIVREPVARLWSSVRMRVSNVRSATGANSLESATVAANRLSYQADCQTLLDTWIEERDGDYMQRSDYAHTLNMLETCVPEARRKVVFFETLFTRETLDEIQDFIGVPREEIPLTDARNVGQEATMRPDQVARLTEFLRPQYDAVCKAMGAAALPDKWHVRFAAAPAQS
jgi:hypothetical protein